MLGLPKERMVTGRKIVFLDIDGTLITDRQEFPESARRLVDEAQRRGHLLFLATGRSLPEIYPWLLDVGFDGIVGGNGSYAQVGDRVLFEHLIPEPRLAALNAYFETKRVDVVFQSSRQLYPSPGFVERFKVLADAARKRGEGGVNLGGADWSPLVKIFQTFLGGRPHEVSKATFVCPDDGSLTLDEVIAHWGEEFSIVHGSLDLMGSENGELVLSGVSKGRAAMEVAQELGIPITDTVAFGDSENDVELIRDCGVGIAMGNARPVVKDVADWVTAPIDEDGLAKGFAHAGLVG